jgi:hypothetical protein
MQPLKLVMSTILDMPDPGKPSLVIEGVCCFPVSGVSSRDKDPLKFSIGWQDANRCKNNITISNLGNILFFILIFYLYEMFTERSGTLVQTFRLIANPQNRFNLRKGFVMWRYLHQLSK